MNFSSFTLLFLVSFSLFAKTSSYPQTVAQTCAITHNKPFYNVAFDGTFDIPHWGHQTSIQNAIAVAAKCFKVPKSRIRLIAGIAGTPEELANYKRPSVYTQEEKFKELSGFKGVYKAAYKALPTLKKFIDKESIDLVVAGDDYEDPKRREAHYAYPHKIGIFATIPRTLGISTSDIFRKAVRVVSETIKKKNLSKADLETIKSYEILVNRHF